MDRYLEHVRKLAQEMISRNGWSTVRVPGSEGEGTEDMFVFLDDSEPAYCAETLVGLMCRNDGPVCLKVTEFIKDVSPEEMGKIIAAGTNEETDQRTRMEDVTEGSEVAANLFMESGMYALRELAKAALAAAVWDGLKSGIVVRNMSSGEFDAWFNQD